MNTLYIPCEFAFDNKKLFLSVSMVSKFSSQHYIITIGANEFF